MKVRWKTASFALSMALFFALGAKWGRYTKTKEYHRGYWGSLYGTKFARGAGD